MSATSVFLYQEKRWLSRVMALTRSFSQIVNHEKPCARNLLFRKESRLFFTPAIYMIGKAQACYLRQHAISNFQFPISKHPRYLFLWGERRGTWIVLGK